MEVSPMVHEMIDGTYRQANLPNESAEYLSKREELRLAEIELLRTATGLVLVGATDANGAAMATM
jgi:hypothetical protein